MKWFKVFESDALDKPDFIKLVVVNGKSFCAVKIDQSVFIIQPYCPHAGAGLSGGWCVGHKIVCPFHRYEYDLYSGRGATGQGDYIDCYTVEKRSDGIYVRLPEKFGFLKRLLKM